MANFSVKSVFAAVDKITEPIKKMARATSAFGKKTEAAMKRASLATQMYSKSNSGLLKNIGALVGATGAIAMLSVGLRTTYNANVELDASLQSLQAITGVTGDAFNDFAKQIDLVSKRQKIFAGDTTVAFELIGSAKPELLKSADALGKVTEAALILGKAGKLEVVDAVNSLTVSMNQFGAGADEATAFVDILATAQQKGSGTIKYLSEAMVHSGGTAKAFGNSFEDTVAILEGFAKAVVPASEAGTMLSGILSKLSKVQNKDFNPQFTKATDIINNLSKANLSYNELMALTDSSGANWLTTIINQNAAVQELSGNLNEVGNAQKQADIQSSSLKNVIDELTASFKNAMSTTNSNNEAMNSLKNGLRFLADNMDKIISLVVTAAKVGGIWLAATLALNAGLKIQMAILAVGKFMKFVKIISMITKAKGAWVAVQWALNAAMTANPVGLIIVGIAALIGIIVLLIKNWDKVKVVFTKVFEFIKSGLKKVGLFLFNYMIAPIEMILKLASKLGVDVATNALKGIDSIRSALSEDGEAAGQEGGEKESKIYNRDYAFNEQASQRQTSANVMLNINNHNNSDISAETASSGVKIHQTGMFN